VLDYKRHWPVGKWREKWQVAYPRAWWNLLDKHAKKRGHPSELQIAFVREESAFDPLRESWANAVGLTQMIHSTAKRFGKGTGIAPTRENLRDPEKNVIIGSNFLNFLYKKWKGSIALVVPSYNTGENRVARWLREKPQMTRDEFSEDIPLDEPRRYNKRVTESFFVYSYLNDGTIPAMPN
jgi:soluble lytic murein transglycosylase